MTVLLKIYDGFASNKYVSICTSATATVLSIYETVGVLSRINPTFFTNGVLSWGNPIVLAVGLCAGAAFALISNTYLAYNDRVKTEGQRNSIYTTLSLIIGFKEIGQNNILKVFFYNSIANPIFKSFEYNFCNGSFFGGFKIAFSATILAIQLLEGKKKL